VLEANRIGNNLEVISHTEHKLAEEARNKDIQRSAQAPQASPVAQATEAKRSYTISKKVFSINAPKPGLSQDTYPDYNKNAPILVARSPNLD